MRFPTLEYTLAVSVAASIAGCAASGTTDYDDFGNDPPLANVDELLAGAPKADEIPRELGKFDEIAPLSHSSVRELMSPVKSQGRRGVCSIFSTAGYMEHLYISAGHDTPDFSEQYLQWSAKFEVNSFPNSSGSNAFYNLRAISDFGIVKEDVWPYEPNQWDELDDAECDGEDDQPTRCYTNGHPSDEIKAAEKFHLPRGRFLSPFDIKGHVMTTNTAVVAGMTFFYQSWNHRKSELPTNSGYWDEGYVLYPNAKDKELSLEKRAGHSFVIFGWDDELEVPIVDENGDQVLDESGEPKTEKGFYLFKNSWGTAGFGIDHELGAGYGYISMRYVHEFASVRVAARPDAPVDAEICGDGLDNDGNGATDCADAVCAQTEECTSNGDFLVFEGQGDLSIPDNNPAGISSSLNIDELGAIADLVVEVDIDHTFRSDLRVTLTNGTETVVLHDRSGGGAHDLVESYELSDFNGADVRGDWRLVVTDNAAIDTGTLRSWSMKVKLAN